MNETITKPLCKDCGKPIFKFEGYMHELELGVQSAAAYPVNIAPITTYSITPHSASPAS